MDEENRRVTRSLSRFANVSEPVPKREEINIPRTEKKIIKIKKEDLEETVIEDCIDLSEDEDSLYGIEEEKPKVRYSQKEISVDRLPIYRGGDFAKFFKEWTNAISLHGERSPREKLFYLPMAFETNFRSLIMESTYCLSGETPNYELFVKDLFMIHGVDMQVEKSVREKLKEIIEIKKRGRVSLTQYIGLFKMNYEENQKQISELDMIKLFLEGLNHKLAKKVERKLTGPIRPTLLKVIELVDKYTIDWEGKRHEGLVFDDEVVIVGESNPTNMKINNNAWERNKTFVRSRNNEERNIPMPFKKRECNACGRSDHTHSECAALRKAILEKLIYRNERGRLCVVATGEEVQKPYGETWISYATIATEEKKIKLNCIIYQEEEEEEHLQVNNMTQYTKTTTMEFRERVEKQISERIDEAMVTVPMKILLDHPGIMYAVKGAHMNKEERYEAEYGNKNYVDHKIATGNKTIGKINSILQDQRNDQVMCQGNQEEINSRQLNADRSSKKIEGSNNMKILGTVASVWLKEDEKSSTMEIFKNDEKNDVITKPEMEKNEKKKHDRG